MPELGFEFIAANVSLAPVWKPRKKTEQNPRQAFLTIITEYGLKPSGNIVPGEKINRCPDAQSKSMNDDAGWWTYHEAASQETGELIAFGSFGSWRDGQGAQHWCSIREDGLSKPDYDAYMAARQADRELRDKIIAEKHAAAAQEAFKLWEGSNTPADGHPYCKRKKIAPTPVQARLTKSGLLIIPAYYDDQICTLQIIDDDGKKFLPGGRAKGAYLRLTESPDDTPVYLCEGFATGMTVAEATGCETWIAFSAGNLGEVATQIRKRYPMRQIVIAGDCDNAGMTYGNSAAQLVGGVAFYPEPAEGKTDFNDYGTDYTRDKLALQPDEQEQASKPEYASALAGMVQDTLNWINSTAFYRQPEISLLNVLSAIGAVTGRRYKLEGLGTRTNLYTIGIAPTGMGKDNSRKCLKTLFRFAELDEFMGSDEIRSGPGMLDHVAQKPSMLYQIDEYGMFLKAMANANTPGYAQTIPAIMTKLWSSSSSTYSQGNLKSEEGPPISIFEPCLSLYGTTTISTYAEAMKSSSVASGELNRYIIRKSAVDYPEPNFDVCDTEPSDALVSYWKRFQKKADRDAIIVRLGDMRGELKRIKMDERELMMKMEPEGLGGVYARMSENIIKVSMLLAIARNPEQPELEHDTLGFAEQLVKDSLKFMVDFGREQMFEDEHHRICNKVIECIKRSGGQITRPKLMMNLHLSKRQMDEVQETLGTQNGSGRIIIDTATKPVTYTLVR